MSFLFLENWSLSHICFYSLFFPFYCNSFFLKQFTRDALITISGAKDLGREFVYFTDVKRIPNTDLATIERLWNKFSKGKFGYTVQKVSQVIQKTKKE